MQKIKPVSRTLNIWDNLINYVEGFEDETVCLCVYIYIYIYIYMSWTLLKSTIVKIAVAIHGSKF